MSAQPIQSIPATLPDMTYQDYLAAESEAAAAHDEYLDWIADRLIPTYDDIERMAALELSAAQVECQRSLFNYGR